MPPHTRPHMNISSAFRLASTACGVGLIGDAMAQQIERQKKGKEPLSIEEWDAARAGRIVVYRAVQAPIVDSAWRSFDLLATRLSLTSLRAVAFKVVLDQALIMPPSVAFFFLSQSLLEGETMASALERTSTGFFPLASDCFMYYSMVHCVTFGAVPPSLRILWVSMAGAVWTAYTSFSNQDLKRRITASQNSRRSKSEDSWPAK